MQGWTSLHWYVSTDHFSLYLYPFNNTSGLLYLSCEIGKLYLVGMWATRLKTPFIYLFQVYKTVVSKCLPWIHMRAVALLCSKHKLGTLSLFPDHLYKRSPTEQVTNTFSWWEAGLVLLLKWQGKKWSQYTTEIIDSKLIRNSATVFLDKSTWNTTYMILWASWASHHIPLGVEEWEFYARFCFLPSLIPVSLSFFFS